MDPITSLDYESFFATALEGPEVAADLYARACAACDVNAKRVLHQAARLASLADWMDKAAPARPALKIFFWVILAEAIAKMAFSFTGTGESRNHVHKFFEELCPTEDRARLASSFRRTNTTPHSLLNTSEAVDVLYNVRNSVAHRGEYFLFNLLEPAHSATITPYEGGTLQALISPSELRAIVIRGAIAGAEKLIAASPAA
jgi:hypothetical protein